MCIHPKLIERILSRCGFDRVGADLVLECMRRFDPSQYSHYLSTYNTHWLYQHHSIDGEEHIGLVCVYKCVCVEREGGEKEGRGSFAGFKWA
jgi:hypothetical protein